jgi:hypothetical protein
VTPLHLDVTAAYSIVASALVVLAGIWVLWGSAWLRRVELSAIAGPAVRALGLRFAREGWRGRVLARGELRGRPVEVRWRGRLDGVVVAEARVGEEGAWTRVPPAEVIDAVRELIP